MEAINCEENYKYNLWTGKENMMREMTTTKTVLIQQGNDRENQLLPRFVHPFFFLPLLALAKVPSPTSPSPSRSSSLSHGSSLLFKSSKGMEQKQTPSVHKQAAVQIRTS